MGVSRHSLSGRIVASDPRDTETQAANAQRLRQLQDSAERAECFDLADRLEPVAALLEWLSRRGQDPEVLMRTCGAVVSDVEKALGGNRPPTPSPELRPDSHAGLLQLMAERRDPGHLNTRKGKLLGQVLVELGILKPDAVERGLEEQRGSGRRLGEVLVELGECTWEQIERGVEVQRRLERAAGMRPQ